MKIPMQPGMGMPDSGSRQHQIGVGEGNKLGHIDICFWSLQNVEAQERSDRRGVYLRDRLVEFLETDEVCQNIFAEEMKDQSK